ncbi:hypothetical protein LTR99_011146 [Exophiala xenobiotica]|uniref:Uncharacterized protein n=1 Tax=Vermiconidia calcicola TaxID=1690605 RepID=A0AAV9PQG4_9PEZI|nr:hypothetical protein LTR72_011765 [Exophiala xenobiotica]KAK5527517.1 hypothetical protein LTR25_011130 [Vermiconidia calcicola]KAK5241993.1 hypothetical protein LTS06_011800 [Exophiala xenobiotica]KAK5258320.1 hypothetical protein LTR40_008122 [Exophiala xenobiotica]KAK5284016.1 hypothetical protein LTR14_011782 [Exophiala xenobiotica]
MPPAETPIRYTTILHLKAQARRGIRPLRHIVIPPNIDLRRQTWATSSHIRLQVSHIRILHRLPSEEKLQAMPPIQATDIQEVSLALRDLPEIPTALHIIP